MQRASILFQNSCLRNLGKRQQHMVSQFVRMKYQMVSLACLSVNVELFTPLAPFNNMV